MTRKIFAIIIFLTISIGLHAFKLPSFSTEKFPKAFRWIADNWSAKDSTYCLNTFYNWSGMINDNLSQEYLYYESPDGHVMDICSRLSNRIGPYVGYRGLVLGTMWNLFTRNADRKNEFTLSINSQLANIDLIRRRTGGDFHVNKQIKNFDMGMMLLDYMGESSEEIGNMMTLDRTGIDVSIFTNHKKFSNPAAYSFGALQIRSAGSPILGLGYANVKFRLSNQYADEMLEGLKEAEEMTTGEKSSYIKSMMDLYKTYIEYFDEDEVIPYIPSFFMRQPQYIRVNDFHLQTGYAYNFVLSRRLLFSTSLHLMPAINFIKIKTTGGLMYTALQKDNLLSELDRYGDFAILELEKYGMTHGVIKDYRDLIPDEINQTTFGLNGKVRASLTYNNDHWMAGVIGQWKGNYYTSNSMKMNNRYWDLSVYLGYFLGRRSDFRFEGNQRNEYIRLALNKQDMTAIQDVNPESNIGHSKKVAPTPFNLDKTIEIFTKKYHEDNFQINVFGCDLVKGPNGKYGTFEIEDGYITPGQDTENRVKVGNVYEIQKDGSLEISVGHKMSYRTGNWWKSHLLKNQTTRQYYPDQLHYALKGKLTLYLRGAVFGNRKPVKLQIPNFYISHGKDIRGFFYIGGENLTRRTTYSLSANVQINNKDYRLFLEESSADKGMNLYVSRRKNYMSWWMKSCRNNTPISKLSIPGTHDSGTSTIPESTLYNMACTQLFPIIDQTKDGIRCFDIRLKQDMKFGHTFTCLEDFHTTMEEWDEFLTDNPSEFIIAIIGSDEGGRWDSIMQKNFQQIIDKYPSRFVQDFKPTTTIGQVRGKILVIKRQEECPYGMLVQFLKKSDKVKGEKQEKYTREGYFDSGFFRITDNYKQFKTAKKLKNVEQSIREAFEDENENRWYITFNSVSWAPRRHNPKQYALGGKLIRYPLNRALSDCIEIKDYNQFGIVMVDFYNGHGEDPTLVENIINTNFDKDYE